MKKSNSKIHWVIHVCVFQRNPNRNFPFTVRLNYLLPFGAPISSIFILFIYFFTPFFPLILLLRLSRIYSLSLAALLPFVPYDSSLQRPSRPIFALYMASLRQKKIRPKTSKVIDTRGTLKTRSLKISEGWLTLLA